MTSTGPITVIPRSIIKMVAGIPQYNRDRVGTVITLDDGHSYRIFREVVMRDNVPNDNGGVFRVWFYALATQRQTMLLSQVTKLFFFGMPGFRGKMWMVNEETGEFGGIYQFDSVEDTRGYAESFAMGLSARRSRPGMFRIEYYAKAGEASLYCAQTAPIPSPADTGPACAGAGRYSPSR